MSQSIFQASELFHSTHIHVSPGLKGRVPSWNTAPPVSKVNNAGPCIDFVLLHTMMTHATAFFYLKIICSETCHLTKHV